MYHGEERESDDVNINMNINDEMNLYKILNLSNDATLQEIKRSYKKLILKYHPDKNKNTNVDNFIKIKYAYEILSNPETKKNYDLNFIHNNYLINFLLIIKKMVITKEYLKIIKILINKIINKNLNLIKSYCFIDFISDFNIKLIIDINLTINFTLKEYWDNKPKLINYNRITKNNFVEYIYPIDKYQIYENEGENIFINNVDQIGNLIININITDVFYNNEKYFILNNDLFIIINENRIIDGCISIKYLDECDHLICINTLNKINNNLGFFYYKENLGLPFYDTDDNTIDINECSVKYGNLYFILLI